MNEPPPAGPVVAGALPENSLSPEGRLGVPRLAERGAVPEVGADREK